MRIKYVAWIAGACLFALVVVLSFAQSSGPVTGDGLVAYVSISNADGKETYIECDWWCNGVDNPDYDSVVGPLLPPYEGESLFFIPQSANLLKGETWTAKIQATDEDGTSDIVEVSVTVGGVPPVVEAARIEVLQTPPPPPDL